MPFFKSRLSGEETRGSLCFKTQVCCETSQMTMGMSYMMDRDLVIMAIPQLCPSISACCNFCA